MGNTESPGEKKYAAYEECICGAVLRRRRKHLIYVTVAGVILGTLVGVGLMAAIVPSEAELTREWLEDGRGRGVDDEIDRVLRELWRMEGLEVTR